MKTPENLLIRERVAVHTIYYYTHDYQRYATLHRAYNPDSSSIELFDLVYYEDPTQRAFKGTEKELIQELTQSFKKGKFVPQQ